MGTAVNLPGFTKQSQTSGFVKNVMIGTIMNAKLPEYLATPTVGKLQLGDKGWTFPWALWADHEGNCWIENNFIVLPEMEEEACMFIERVDGGFIVDIARIPDNASWKLASKDDSREIVQTSTPVLELLEPAESLIF